MEAGLSLLAVFALVAANGFFVATEFALVSVRRTRMEQLAAQGSARARGVLDAINHLDAYIAATQLGITMASLALGWIGEPAFAHILGPIAHAIPFLPADARDVASHSISAATAFVIITALHIVLGELAPKSLALQRAEATALAVSGPIHVFLAVFRLPIMALNSIGNAVVRLFGIQPAAGHALVQSTEELRLSVAASREAGLLQQEAQEVVDRALSFTTQEAHDFMVPRPEVVAVPSDVGIDELVAIVEQHQHSRYPVYEGSPDNVIGIVAAKRILTAVARGRSGSEQFDVRDYITPPHFVPETVPGYRLLAEMKARRTHMAIVVDEYGDACGLVTLRDITSRLAGEVPDEAEGQAPEVQWLPGGVARVEGLMRLSELNSLLGAKLDDEDYDTLGGLIFGKLGRRPRVGDTVELGGYQFTVDEVDGARIAWVRVAGMKPDPGALAPASGA